MENGFKIIGISVRTTNENSQAIADLGRLWNQFISENIVEKIPNKISNDVLAIYTDYKSNFEEEYQTIIGVPVSSIDKIPEGLIGREFPKENFKKFIAKGEIPESVGKTWMEIWQNDEELNRKYSYDFEFYGAKSQNGEESEVEIFIAVN